MATCEWCGRKILSERRGVRFCSTNCANHAARKRANLRKKGIEPPKRKCAYCGKELEGTSRIYCDKACRLANEMECRRKARAQVRADLGLPPRRQTVKGPEEEEAPEPVKETRKAKEPNSFGKKLEKLGSGRAYVERQKAESIARYATLDIESQIRAIKARG